MQSTLLSVGETIEARCTKCRKNTEHTLIKLAEQTPVDVQCQKCSHLHKYRPPLEKKAAVKQSKPIETEKKEWAALRPNMNSAEATDYCMTDAYKAKALINHPLFGLGLVLRVAGTQKIEVLFEAGKKMMRCK